MREILFRGKRKKGDKRWVDGDLTHGYAGYVGIMVWCCAGSFFEVVPETVGQYTGLTDKNGKKIFEGDIVSCNYFCGVVYFYEGAWCVSEKDKYPEDLYDLINIEVIGNIYDTPELIKE